MYRIHILDNAEWSIADCQGRIAFRGTPRECEDWLDFQENCDASAAQLEAGAVQPRGSSHCPSQDVGRRIEIGTPVFPFSLRKLASYFSGSRRARSKLV